MDLLRKIAKKVVNHKYYKHGKNFSKYLIVGIIWTALNIASMWFFIDIRGFPTVYASSVIAAVLFFGKFYVYLFVNLIENKFLKYASATIGFYLSSIFFMWLFVDVMGLKAVTSSTIIVAAFFVLRFLFFYKVGLIKNEKGN